MSSRPKDGPGANVSFPVNLNPVLQLPNGDILIDMVDLLLLSSYVEQARVLLGHSRH